MRSILFLLILLTFWGCQETQEKETNSSEHANNFNQMVKSNVNKPIEKVDSTLLNMEIRFGSEYLIGKLDPKIHPDFEELSLDHASSEGMYLRKDTYESYKRMYAAAKEDGIDLKIISATRPFDHQKRIWEGKWTGKRMVEGQDVTKTISDPVERALKILRYSSMPGTSRHHWGTDLDINDLENSYFESGKGLKIYEWMTENAASYGFCQPYSPKGEDRQHGYEEEKWHWSYIPVSIPLLQEFESTMNNSDITGFLGSETASEIGVIEKYVSGIHHSCKQ